MFNICRNVVSIPKDGTGGNACASTVHDVDDEGHETMDSTMVPAFMVSNVESKCNRVSSDIEKGNIDFKLYGSLLNKIL